MLIRDGNNLTKHIRTSGTGTAQDPFVMINDVAVQDQITNTVILPLVHQHGVALITSEAVVESYTVPVNNTTGAVVGDHFRIINSAADTYYYGTILEINGLVITLDTPIDFPYVNGSEATYSTTNMAVDGSVTPMNFNLRTGNPSIPSSIDITRLIMVCECDKGVDLNKFGDINDGLYRGIVFRKINSHTNNIFNIKSNRDLCSLGYDWTPYDESKTNQGIHGFSWRLTFAGQDKLGVALRVEQNGQLEMIIQDDLTSLTSLICMVEGHVVI